MTLLLPKDSYGCPRLILAPMEGVGDVCFRKAIATIGGFDEAVRDFLRVPSNAHVKSLAAVYDPTELGSVPLAVQLMGGDPILMAEMAKEVERLGAKRIDLNCGCPSNTVTGRGAGSSLLKDPDHLFTIAREMVKSVNVPVTAKLRSGFDDTSLFYENLHAAQESGIAYLTLHPRTKADGYHNPANWELIAEAKRRMKIPVVGNGDILNVEDALRMLKETHCDALMIGRGSVINPFIFLEIKAHFAGQDSTRNSQQLIDYLYAYYHAMAKGTPERTKINKIKQLIGFLFKASAERLEKRQSVLQLIPRSALELIETVIPLLVH